jgi:hypothetical protein
MPLPCVVSCTSMRAWAITDKTIAPTESSASDRGTPMPTSRIRRAKVLLVVRCRFGAAALVGALVLAVDVSVAFEVNVTFCASSIEWSMSRRV